MKDFEKYVEKFERIGNILYLYVKIPFGVHYSQIRNYFKSKYDDKTMSFLDVGIDVIRKEVILPFILRNKEDIEPYLDYDKNFIPKIEIRKLIDKRQQELTEQGILWKDDIKLKTYQEIYYMGENK